MWYSLFSSIHSAMVLQPFFGPWPLLQFRNLFSTDDRTPWTSDQLVGRPLPIHTIRQTQNKRTDIHALSGIRTHDPSIGVSKDSSCLRQRGNCDRRYSLFTLPNIKTFCIINKDCLKITCHRYHCSILALVCIQN
jgi:hypothetical protein